MILGTLLADAIEEQISNTADLARPDYLVPVPLSWRRLIRRGHNQAVLIARPISRSLRIPLLHQAVSRTRHTPIQPGLSADIRKANVLGAFVSNRHWNGECLAVIDDVMTTGTTVNSIAEVLLGAGAGEIQAWCATRTIID